MEAEPVDALPSGAGWLFEPKYDGFRAIGFREGSRIALQSRNRKPLDRYFPEIVGGFLRLPVSRFVLDGEIVIPGQSFETLQLRLHPAESRIDSLAKEYPASFIAFDMLADETGASLLHRPFADRREALIRLMERVGKGSTLVLSQATRSAATARRWLGRSGLDGIVAKRLDARYTPGKRAMKKYKLWKTVDCVVGGLYWKRGTRIVDSLLLGLYDEAHRLNYVGRARAPSDAAALGERLKPLIGGAGFTGRAPGGKSRWSGRERAPVPLDPVLVVEVSADHITDDYMRHGARLLRWREDKRPEDCTMDQIR